jgi:rRNA maturation RNase YbeY
MAIRGLSVNLENGIKIKKKSVHSAVKIIKTELKKSISALDINFVGTETIYFINDKFLGHKYATDVISFDYSNESNSFDGEIFICVDIAKENSKRFKVTFDNELKRLLIHGFLHFSGFDDKTNSQREKMKAAENDLLILFRRIKFI